MNNTIFKGYPYGTAKSLEIFPSENRPTGQQIEARAKEGLGVSSELLQVYSKALHEAEQQIKDLQLDYPFLPEDYGFIQLNEFEPKYRAEEGNISLLRINDTSWHIKAATREVELHDNTISEEKSPINLILTIRNEKEAYMAFKLLGLTKYIKTKADDVNTDTLVSTHELVLNHPELPEEPEDKNDEPGSNKPTEENDNTAPAENLQK